MTTPIVTPANCYGNIAKEAYEFVTLNSRQNFAAITEILKQLNIKLPHEIDDALTSALCDLEEAAFLSGFAMGAVLPNVPMIAGGG